MSNLSGEQNNSQDHEVPGAASARREQSVQPIRRALLKAWIAPVVVSLAADKAFAQDATGRRR